MEQSAPWGSLGATLRHWGCGAVGAGGWGGVEGGEGFSHHTPPPCPSNGKLRESDGTNAKCCLDKDAAYATHCAWYMRKDMLYYSETKGQNMPQRSSCANQLP